MIDHAGRLQAQRPAPAPVRRPGLAARDRRVAAAGRARRRSRGRRRRRRLLHPGRLRARSSSTPPSGSSPSCPRSTCPATRRRRSPPTRSWRRGRVARAVHAAPSVGFSSLDCHARLTYRFLDDVLGELAALTPGPYLHIGGDEAHSTSREDYLAFMARVQPIVARPRQAARRLGGDRHRAARRERDRAVLAHRPGRGRRADPARRGRRAPRLIMSPAKHVYLDMKYDESTGSGLTWAGYVELRDSYEWESGELIAGVGEDVISASRRCLWSETITNAGGARDDAAPAALRRRRGRVDAGGAARLGGLPPARGGGVAALGDLPPDSAGRLALIPCKGASAQRPPAALPERSQQLPRVRAQDGARSRPRARRDPAASARRGLTPSWSPSAAASTRPRTAGGWRPRAATSRWIEHGEEAVQDTLDAMRDGRDVIYQAAFRAGNWSGFADFLLRVEEPSELGAWSYEPADAKLATHPKPYFIFQLLFYADMVARIQGRAPAHVHVVLGTDETPLVPPARLPGLRRPRAAALPGDAEGLPRRRGAAVPVSRRALRLLRLVDALPRPAPRRRPPVAGRLPHARAVDPAGGRGRADGDRRSPGSAAGRRSRGSRASTLAGLRQQAWLQVREPRLGPAAARAAAARARARVRPPARRRRPATSSSTSRATHTGAARGSSTCSARPPPTAPTGRCGRTTAAQERRAFETWVDWVTERLREHPDMHVYHYNHYEPTAVKKLMTRYGTREAEVDDLLRRKVFVDLYAVVRQAMRIGDGELLAEGRRGDVPVRARRRGHRGGRLDPRLPGVPQTGRDERARRRSPTTTPTTAARRWRCATGCSSERGGRRLPRDRPAARAERGPARPDGGARAPARPRCSRGAPDAGRVLVADLLRFHRREARPEWWAYFDRLGRTPAELRDEDTEAIGELTPADDVPLGEVAQSYLHPLRFPPQQHKLVRRASPSTPRPRRATRSRAVDDEAGLVWLKRGRQSRRPAAPARADPAQADPAGRPGGRAAPARRGGRAAAASAPGAAHDLLLRLPPGAARRDARGERRLARRLGAVHPGPARLGQDLDGRAADLLAAARRAPRSAWRRPRTRRSPTCWTPSRRRPATSTSAG